MIEEREGQNVAQRTWNSEGRLIAYAPSNAIHENYTYNADGIRVKKVVGNRTSNFILDGQNIVAETNDNGETVAEWTHASGNWGDLISEYSSENTHTFAFDPSSNTRLHTEASGDISVEFLNDAFGVERDNVPNSAWPFRYAGAFGCSGNVELAARWRCSEAPYDTAPGP